jgi:hypothetical protein
VRVAYAQPNASSTGSFLHAVGLTCGVPLLSYLCSPYTHRDPEVMLARFEHAAKATGWLIKDQAWNVFSPIVHSHPLAVIGGLSGKWDFWERIDREYLSLSERVVVLTLPGWRESVGVTAELEFSRKIQRPIWYLIPEGPDNYLLIDKEPLEEKF